jgi:hypothetical protein
MIVSSEIQTDEQLELLLECFKTVPFVNFKDKMPEILSYTNWLRLCTAAFDSGEQDKILHMMRWSFVNDIVNEKRVDGQAVHQAELMKFYLRRTNLASDEDRQTLEILIDKYGFEVNNPLYTSDGSTLLSAAIMLSDMKLIQLLMRKRANFNHFDAAVEALSEQQFEALASKEKEKILSAKSPMHFAIENAQAQILNWCIASKGQWKPYLWASAAPRLIESVVEKDGKKTV